ncbi:MAG: hypothetical protein FWE76_02510 [Symbiobacteriaceae bacterium]|nr:hypothetical protein [Symbiobacteriaceae bacterium]
MLFPNPGQENTAQTLAITLNAAREKEISQIVIASTAGEVALAFLPYAHEFRIVCVGHAYYFRPDVPNTMSDEVQEKIREGGMILYFGSHVLSGAERGLSSKLQGTYPVEIMAHTLRMFGPGVKVGVECAVMALDAGLIEPSPLIAVGGTGRGADTAIILTPASASRILDTKVHEILCKPSYYR